MNHTSESHKNNFGAIRYIMALAVVLAHFSVQTGTFTAAGQWLGIGSYVAVTGFFILSGFLVYQSRERSSNSIGFLRKRLTRIFPSYLTVVLFCAIAFAPLSNLDLGEFFTHSEWRRYVITNSLTLNFLQPTLPELFSSHPNPAVNGSLWTIKVELFLYMTLIPVFLIMRRFKIRPWIILGSMIALSLIYVEGMDYYFSRTGNAFFHSMQHQFLAQLGFFYAGMACFIYLDFIKRHSRTILAICGLLTAGIIFFLFDTLHGRFVMLPLSLAGLVTSAAFTGKWGFLFNRFENCSYEMYLWHMPVIHLTRHFNLHQSMGTLGGLAFVIVLTAMAAYVTAHYISTPLRRKLSATPVRR